MLIRDVTSDCFLENGKEKLRQQAGSRFQGDRLFHSFPGACASKGEGKEKARENLGHCLLERDYVLDWTVTDTIILESDQEESLDCSEYIRTG